MQPAVIVASYDKYLSTREDSITFFQLPSAIKSLEIQSQPIRVLHSVHALALLRRVEFYERIWSKPFS